MDIESLPALSFAKKILKGEIQIKKEKNKK